MARSPHVLPAALIGALMASGDALAQESQGAYVALELNAVEGVDDACRISFLIQNGHAVDIASVVYEAVLFDRDGRVDRLTLFDFGSLPAARPRVRQFLVPGLACGSLGRLLVNGAETCTGDGLPQGACTTDLDLSSKTDVEILG